MIPHRTGALQVVLGALAIATAVVGISSSLRGHTAIVEANHAWPHDQGVGYDGLGSGFGWVDVHVIPESTGSYAAALDAVDNWRALHYVDLWWLRHVTDASVAQAEVIDRDTATVFGGTDGDVHLYICNTHFIPTTANPYLDDAYATTIVTDTLGDVRLTDGNGFWIQRPGISFWHATACLNSHHTNDTGTIAHELGHVLGLDHPTASGAACPESGIDTIMAYNYDLWAVQWPSDLKPTFEDEGGPWACNGLSPPWLCGAVRCDGGLAYVYHLGGLSDGGGTYTPTPTPTVTRTPTRTPTPAPPPTATPTPVDIDGDGFLNPQSTTHQGPANTNTATDNCPVVFNPAQTNTDGNFIDTSPPRLFDDITWPNSDQYGDACDPDRDNDGLTNAQEQELGPGDPVCPSATGHTDPVKPDTDGDRALDGAECALGTDPASAASFPPASPAGDTDHDGLTDAFELTIGTNPNNVDTDGDLILDGVEVRYYNTNPLSTNGDGDACGDGKEIGSVNDDTKVNSTDLLIISQSQGNAPGPPYVTDFDLNKDGKINSTDLLLDANLGGSFCP